MRVLKVAKWTSSAAIISVWLGWHPYNNPAVIPIGNAGQASARTPKVSFVA
jgi:hypothetical protein